MVDGGLGPSAIRSYTNVVKIVVASAVNEEGEQLYPRQWNHAFIDLPPDNNPKRPWFTGDVVTKIVAAAKKPVHRMLYALCATKAWRGQVHNFLKTENGKREVDLHPKMAARLKEFIGQSGLLFCSRTGKQLMQADILRRSLHPILEELGEPKCGVHAFRRFRLTHIRELGVPKDLEHFSMGHEGRSPTPVEGRGKEIGDIYSMPPSSVQVRQENCSLGRNGRKLEVEPVLELAAIV